MLEDGVRLINATQHRQQKFEEKLDREKFNTLMFQNSQMHLDSYHNFPAVSAVRHTFAAAHDEDVAMSK